MSQQLKQRALILLSQQPRVKVQEKFTFLLAQGRIKWKMFFSLGQRCGSAMQGIFIHGLPHPFNVFVFAQYLLMSKPAVKVFFQCTDFEKIDWPTKPVCKTAKSYRYLLVTIMDILSQNSQFSHKQVSTWQKLCIPCG